MVEQLNRFIFPEEWNYKRNPARPLDLRVLDFDKLYDWDTVWNDAVQINQNIIVLIGPPLYEFSNYLVDNCGFLDGNSSAMPFRIEHLDRAAMTIINTSTFLDNIRLSTPNGVYEIPVNQASTEFADKKVIVTISRNHPIPWLQQWIDYHRVVHNLDGMLIYNNRSTLYTSEQLANALHRSDMIVKIVDYDVPFGVMGGSEWEWEGRKGDSLPWDSDFSQYVMLEHAKRRYLYNAKLVINADTDELLVFKNLSLDQLGDYCKNSDISALRYASLWIEPINSVTGEIAESIPFEQRRFKDYWKTTHSKHKGIGIKWMLNPARNLVYQWRLHDITGPIATTEDICFGHYLAMNTSWSWKRDKLQSDTSKLVSYDELKKNLDLWYANTGS